LGKKLRFFSVSEIVDIKIFIKTNPTEKKLNFCDIKTKKGLFIFGLKSVFGGEKRKENPPKFLNLFIFGRKIYSEKFLRKNELNFTAKV
jgi:hypothetical protein